MSLEKVSQSASIPLVDVQKTPDTRGLDIQQVGVKNVEIPLLVLQKDGHTQHVSASVSLSVGVSKTQKGTHLSRFVIQLSEISQDSAFCFNLKNFLTETQSRLEAQSAYIRIDFRYFIPKKAPVTDFVAPMAYACYFEASLVKETYAFYLGLEVPIATLCPCSKAISDYGAHNQRAIVRIRLNMDTQSDHPMMWIEDLVSIIDECASCPVYPILKREDEKYVTERAYDNPKFVEDVIRDVTASLQILPAVCRLETEVEALESIHGHNAWAFHSSSVK